MDKLFVAFCLLILNSISATCQTYSDATIVLSNGDTLKGRLSFDPLSKPSGLLFKGQKNAKATKYKPSHLTSYRFEGREEVWVSRAVKRGDVLDSAFVLAIVSGRATLYKSQISTDKRFYAQKGNSPIEELMDELITKRVDGNLISYNSEKFKGQLKLLFADCPSMEKSLIKAAMLESRLIKLFEEYNACVDLSGVDK
jgi:hypothetical protein